MTPRQELGSKETAPEDWGAWHTTSWLSTCEEQKVMCLPPVAPQWGMGKGSKNSAEETRTRRSTEMEAGGARGQAAGGEPVPPPPRGMWEGAL